MLPGVPDGAGEAWFARRHGAFYVFRVNRRPLAEVSLFEQRPDSVLDHFHRMLAPAYQVVTGRGHKRGWKVGRAHSGDEGVLVGKLGWYPLGKKVQEPDWSEEEQDWVSLDRPASGGVLPFGFDGESRLLTVLLDAESRPSSVAMALEKILQDNEDESLQRSTDWAVEPVLDAREFVEWLHSLDVVQWIKFEARMPNPEPMDQFRRLHDRLSRHDATKITETISSEKERGLVDVEKDQEFREGIAMGEQSFATLRGQGQRDGKVSTFRQNEQVARERVEELPPTWDDIFALIGDLLKDRLRRFLDEDQGD